MSPARLAPVSTSMYRSVMVVFGTNQAGSETSTLRIPGVIVSPLSLFLPSIHGQLHNGGLRDKPGKPRDYYHTCYALSGLAAAQHTASLCPQLFLRGRTCGECEAGRVVRANCVLGAANNILPSVHPLCNVRMDKYEEAVAHYGCMNEEEP